MALYRAVAEDTLDYCLRELKGEEGGFFCGQDADSNGTEGAYYLFTPDEVAEVLGAEAGRHFCECYDITAEGNFHGKSIPNLLLNNRWSFLPEGYDEYRERLRLYREERMTLFTDNKILTAWNGLMLMALSRAARAFDDRRYRLEAQELAAFMADRLTENGRLKARLCEGELRFEAGLEDVVFYALGLTELYAADFDPAHIVKAAELAALLPEEFADGAGGFFSTGVRGETLILRPKEYADGAMPSGNSAAAVLLQRLFLLTAEEKWRALMDKQFDYLAAAVGEYPASCCYAMSALALRNHGTKETVAALPDESFPPSLRTILERWSPELTVLVKTPARAGALTAAAPFTADMGVRDGKATYYVCTGGACARPVTD